MNSQVMIDREFLERIHRDLDACQKVIWLGLRGADPSYCADAQARLKEIDELLATPTPIPDAGEGVDFWWADEPLADRALVMKVADHNRIVSALQASAMGVPDGWKLVPVELTPEMVVAAVREAGRQESLWQYNGASFWRVLLAASPAPGDSKIGIKRYEFRCSDDDYMERPDGSVVLHADHLAAMAAASAFDEAVERAAFEVWFSDHARRVLKWDESDIESEFQLDDDGEYVWGSAISAFDGWRAACQSRAKRFGCDV